MQIVVKNYQHFNRSLPGWDSPKGKWISSRSQYEKELAKAGMKQVSDFGQTSEPVRKDYELSTNAKAILEAAKNSKDKKGRVRLSDNTIKAMESIGAIKKQVPSYMKLPSAYHSGGFINE